MEQNAVGAIQSSNAVKFGGRREGTGLNGCIPSNVFIYPKFAQQNHSPWFRAYTNGRFAGYDKVFLVNIAQKLAPWW